MAEKKIDILIRARDKASVQFDKLGGKLQNFGRNILSLRGLIGGVAIGASLRQMVGLFEAQEQAELRLAQALRSAGFEADANAEKMKRAASALQRVSTVGDEVTLANQAMALSMGATVEQAIKVGRVAADLSVALGMDVATAARSVSQTLSGTVGTLGRLIPELREFTAEQLKNGDAIDMLAKRYAGFAATTLDTFQGQRQQLANSFGDLGEALGQKLTEGFEAGAGEGFLKGLREDVDYITSVIQRWNAPVEETSVIGSLKWLAANNGLTLALGAGRAATTRAGSLLAGRFEAPRQEAALEELRRRGERANERQAGERQDADTIAGTNINNRTGQQMDLVRLLEGMGFAGANGRQLSVEEAGRIRAEQLAKMAGSAMGGAGDLLGRGREFLQARRDDGDAFRQRMALEREAAQLAETELAVLRMRVDAGDKAAQAELRRREIAEDYSQTYARLAAIAANELQSAQVRGEAQAQIDMLTRARDQQLAALTGGDQRRSPLFTQLAAAETSKSSTGLAARSREGGAADIVARSLELANRQREKQQRIQERLREDVQLIASLLRDKPGLRVGSLIGGV